MSRRVYTLILPLPPSVNHMYLRRRGGGVRLSPDAAAWKQQAYYAALEVFPEALVGGIEVVYDFYFPDRRPDIDNSLKALNDALQGAAYINDRQIMKITASKHLDKRNPRVEVALWEITNA